MKTFYNLISTIQDQTELEHPINNDTNNSCPPAVKIHDCMLYLSTYFNKHSKRYNSAELLDKAEACILQAQTLIPKAAYNLNVFTLSILQVQDMLLTMDAYSEQKSPMLSTIRILLDEYIESSLNILNKINTAKQLIGIVNSNNLNEIDLEDLSVEKFSIMAQAAFNLSRKDTKSVQYIANAVKAAHSLLSLIEPDNNVISLTDEKINLQKTRTKSSIYDYLNAIVQIYLVSKDAQLEKALHYLIPTYDISSKSNNTDLICTFIGTTDETLSVFYSDISNDTCNDISKDKALSQFNGFQINDRVYRHKVGTAVTQTIYADQDIFYSINCGGLSMRMRTNATFFGPKGRFKAERIQGEDNRFSLSYTNKWGYWKTMEDNSKPSIIGSDINKVDREMMFTQQMDVNIDIVLLQDGADITINFDKVDDLACKVDFIFDKDGLFQSESSSILTSGNHYIQLQKGDFSYTSDNQCISVGPAFDGRAIFAENLRGSQPPVDNAFTVYFTDMTPTSRTIKVRGQAF